MPLGTGERETQIRKMGLGLTLSSDSIEFAMGKMAVREPNRENGFEILHLPGLFIWTTSARTAKLVSVIVAF